MKKNFKLVLAILLAAMMIVGSFAAIAAPATVMPDSTYDDTLTINGLDAGDIVTLYQLLEWVGSDYAGTSATPNQGDDYSGWLSTADYTNELTKVNLKTMLYDDPDTSADERELITAERAGKLAKLATAATQVAEKTAAGETVTFDVTAPGLYMALITPADPDTVYNPVFVSSDFFLTNNTEAWTISTSETYSDKAAAKKGKNELEKTASTSAIESTQNWDDDQWTTTAIGETVEFTVETTIPGYGMVYESPYFVLRDVMTDLELNTTSVTLVEPSITLNDDYTIDATPSGYTIVFMSDYLKTVNKPTKVKVTYSAKVSTSAPLNVNVEKNQVSTEFSHNPADESDHKFKKDATEHYTFTIDASALGFGGKAEGKYGSEIVKVGVDAEGKPIKTSTTYSAITSENYQEGPLAGAKFQLCTDAAGNVPYIFKDKTGTALNPQPEIKSGADGRMEIAGLDAGIYYLKEIEAPAGFVKSNHIVKIEIKAYTDEIEVTEWTGDGIKWVSTSSATASKSYTYKTNLLTSYDVFVDDVRAAHHQFENAQTSTDVVWTDEGCEEIPSSIANVKGVELPSTGGVGTTIFYVGGSLMVLAAAILLITKRRMGVED